METGRPYVSQSSPPYLGEKTQQEARVVLDQPPPSKSMNRRRTVSVALVVLMSVLIVAF